MQKSWLGQDFNPGQSWKSYGMQVHLPMQFTNTSVILNFNLPKLIALERFLDDRRLKLTNYLGQSQLEQTRRWTNQNSCKLPVTNVLKARENHVRKVQLVLVLLLIGWKNCEIFLNQSLSVPVTTRNYFQHWVTWQPLSSGDKLPYIGWAYQKPIDLTDG